MTTRKYTTGAAIANITDSAIKELLYGVDTEFNDPMIGALAHGLYTGIVVVTLWATASRYSSENCARPHFLTVIILTLYLLATVNLYYGWSEATSCLISTDGRASWEVYQSYLAGRLPKSQLIVGIDAILSTNLADATLIWRCWIVWGRSWRVVLVPIASTIMATASRGIVTYYQSYFGPITSMAPKALYIESVVNWAVVYSSLILATLLWCTILIIYRILRVSGAPGRIGVYRRVIEMLVESAFLYSVLIVVVLVFEIHNQVAAGYVQELAIAMRGIAPTILVGRVAAGHARPDDSWSEGTMRSSLQFRNISSSQNDSEIHFGPGSDTSSRVTPDLEEESGNNRQSQDRDHLQTFNTYEYSRDVEFAERGVV